MSVTSNAAPPNILIVNDARDTLELVKFSFAREGYRVLTAANGREALEIARRELLDAIISDVVMPEMDGVELCRELKRDCNTAQIPILLCSAIRTSESDSLSGLRAGADDYLEIPFRQQELLIKAARLIERARVENYFRQIVESSPNIIYTLDKNNRLLNINAAGVRFFGRDFDELIERDEAALLAAHVAPFDASVYKRILEQPKTILEMQNRDGERRTMELRRKPFHDNTGSVTGFHCVVQDFTERFAAERAVRENEQRYRTLYEDSPLMYFVLSARGTVLSVNKTAVEKLGYTESELLGASVLDVFLSEDRARVREQIELLKRSETGVAQWEFRKVHRDGSIVYVSENVRLLPQDNGAPIFLVICEDITERVAAERKAAEVIEQLGEVARREELINRITNLVRKDLRLETIFNIAVNELGAQLAVDRAVLYLFDEKTALPVPRAAYSGANVVDEPLEYHNLPALHNEPLFKSFSEIGFIAFDEIGENSISQQLYRGALKPRNIRSLMCVAIKTDGALTGFITFSMHGEARRWSETDAALARAVAAQIGVAVRQAQLYAGVEKISQREALINRLSTAIRRSLQLSEVITTATRELCRALDASQVYINFYDPARHNQPAAPQYVYAAPSRFAPPAPLPVNYDSNVGRYLLAERQTVLINNVNELIALARNNSSEYKGNAHRASVKSAMFCPIVVNDDFRGTLFVEQIDRERAWTDDDRALTEAVAAQLALGIAHAELYETTRRAKREWETTFDAMGDGLFIFDCAGKLIRVNRAGAAMERREPGELLGKNCCELLLAEGSDNVCVIQRVVETGVKHTSEQQSRVLKRPLLITDEPIFDDADKLVGVVCTVRDLSELRQAEAVARERQRLLSGVLEGVLEPIFAVDRSGKLLWCNNATAEIYAATIDEIVRRDFLEMAHPDDAEISRAALAASFQKLPQFYEARFVTGAGETRHAVFNSVPLVLDSAVNTVLWFVRDITKQKAAVQQALQADKLRALGQLASGVAHDFNNGLAAILGRVQILERQVCDHEVLRNLSIIKTAAEDAAATVRRVQSFAKQSALPEFAVVETSALVRDSIEITRTRWEHQARAQNICYKVELTIRTQPDQPETFPVYGNASELREVFVNLIVNALDAMPDGGELEIVCERAGDNVRLTFADQGAGIAEDVRERIFEPFFSTKGVNGTGLGLSVSYGIVEQHGGSIHVISAAGKGTTFVIALPISSLAKKRQEENAAMLQQAKKDLRILVVDDEQIVREALTEMLEEFATEVVGAVGAHDALQKLAAQRFDVVFTDFSMPEMDGLDLAEKIAANWAWTKIVLVTGYGKAVTIAPEKRALIHRVVGKPFDFAQLSQTLEDITL